MANKSLRATRDGGSDFALRLISLGPVCPVVGRYTAPLISPFSTNAGRSSSATMMTLARSE